MRYPTKSSCLVVAVSAFLILIHGCAQIPATIGPVTTEPKSPTQIEAATLVPMDPKFSLTAISPSLESPDTLISPPIFLTGSVDLEAGGTDPSKWVFDFDSGKPQIEQKEMNDLAFGLTGTKPFPILVLGPAYGALAAPLKDPKADFQFSECSSLGIFGKGGIPIPALDTHYCWKTNEGRMAQIVVDKIENLDPLYRIEIRYVVWEND